jgi:hypothetical protein
MPFPFALLPFPLLAQNVESVLDGRRQVLIIEVWSGHKSRCAQRCESHWECGACDAVSDGVA